MDKVFFIDRHNKTYSYSALLYEVSNRTCVADYCSQPETIDVFVELITSMIYSEGLVLLDADFSEQELDNIGIDSLEIKSCKVVIPRAFSTVDELISTIERNKSWQLTMFTSGTTGIPKRVTHTLASLSRLVRKSERHKDDVWGYAYNPTHIAGIQVFLQALINLNTMIDLFRLPKAFILQQIANYQVSNISATPTFYRLLMPISGQFKSVMRLTSGGERFDPKLSELLIAAFPKAQLRNIYASTEAGSVLKSKNDLFSIRDARICRVEDGQLWIHKSLLGVSNNLDEWYNTGDLIEIVDDVPLRFRFVSRVSEMINVGGYKVNPIEVESIICEHPSVTQAFVYGKANALLGNILMADVVSNNVESERELRGFMKLKLQDYKIPRIINFVESISTTRSGKLKRN